MLRNKRTVLPFPFLTTLTSGVRGRSTGSDFEARARSSSSAPGLTEPTPAAAASPAARTSERLTLVGATALVVGSIVGVGIFNLPTSLAPYGPITLVSMGLTTIGALALAMLSRRCRARCRPTAGRMRDARARRSGTSSGSRTPGRRGQPPGPVMPRSTVELGAVRRGVRQTGRPRSGRSSSCWPACGSRRLIDLSGIKNIGLFQVVPRPIPKFAGLAFIFDRRAVLHRDATSLPGT